MKVTDKLDKHQLAHARLMGAVSSPIRPGIVAISLEDGENILEYIKHLQGLVQKRLDKIQRELDRRTDPALHTDQDSNDPDST